MALPREVVSQLLATLSGYVTQSLATGNQEQFDVQEMEIEWWDEARGVEVIVTGGEPLIGTTLLTEMLLQAEMTQGGEVSISSL